MTNLHILLSWFFTAITTSLSATRDHFLHFQFNPLILNAITLRYNWDLLQDGRDVTVVPLLPFQINTAGKCLSNLKKRKAYTAQLCLILYNFEPLCGSVRVSSCAHLSCR